jgi:hypothetical protein
MKTQLVYLDAHDDVASALERLRWVQADRVVLVWPSHGRILNRRLDLVRLAREASRRAAQLGVLSHDPDVRAEASHLNLPVFDDLDSVSRRPWPDPVSQEGVPSAPSERGQRPPRPEATPPAIRRGWTDAQRAVTMLVVIAALLGLSVVVGPAAVVELVPVERDESAALAISFAQDDGGAVVLPSRVVSVDVEGEIQFPTTGTVQVPTSSAVGLATFTNRSEGEVILPEGTGLRTVGETPLRFETTERALVPAVIGVQIDVPLRAAAAGPAGNVAADTITAIEGSLGLDLTVTNPEPTAGGASQNSPGVTAADLGLARAALERQLIQAANARLQEGLEAGEALAPDSVAVARVLSSEFRPTPGEPSRVIQGAMTARVEAIAYQVDRLQAAAESAIAERAEAGREITPGSVRVDLIPASAVASGRYQARIRRRTRAQVDFGAMAQAIQGRTTPEAGLILMETLDLQASPRFRLWPEWWPRLPFLPLRIQPVWLSTP